MKRIILFPLLMCLLIPASQVRAQFNYTIEMDSLVLTHPPAVHSGAMAKWNGKWLFIAGRKNGLHDFLPPSAFPISDANTDILVVDPLADQTWTGSVDSLSTALAEPLASSNVEYYQQDSVLYITGGYGWKNTLGAFHTFPTLTAVNVPQLMTAVQSGTSIIPYFRQVTDSFFQVCGGNLEKVDSVFYLVFGQDFEGTYNVVDTLGNFVQHYTYAVRRFQLHDDGTNITVYNKSTFTDTADFRRRDYNLVPQIFPSGEYGMTAFTGVFQHGINLPYLNTIDIKPSAGPSIVPGFNQNLSQYHCATLPLYSGSGNNMYSMFFGGMSMYRLDTATHTLLLDSLIPFVKTISLVKRDGNGVMTEIKLPIEWKSYEGSDAYFVLSDSVSLLYNRIINLDSIHHKTLAGYIVGGIISPDSNISQTGSTVSHANSMIYKVYLNTSTTGIHYPEVKEPVSFDYYPNPSPGRVTFNVSAEKNQHVQVTLLDETGNPLEVLFNKNVSGKSSFQWNAHRLPAGIYYCKLETKGYRKVYKLVLTN